MYNLMKRRSLHLVTLAVMSFVFISCSKEDEKEVESKALDLRDEAALKSLGFSTANTKDMGNYYVVEEDIRITKSLLRQQRENWGSKLKQAMTSSLINYPNQKKITVGIANSIPTSGEDNWRPEILDAINEWNKVHYSCNLILTYTSASNPDILISDDAGVLGNLVLAQASFPENGKPGPSIIINLDAVENRVFSSSQKKYNMVHELGHCLGFRHTNWYNPNPLYCETPGIGVPGTPNTGYNPDPKSIMNGGTALNSWNGFSTNDSYAASAMYPKFSAGIYNFPTRLNPSELNREITIGASCNMPNVAYSWSVSGGVFVSGQGTSSIVVKPGSPITFGVSVRITNNYGEAIDISKWVEPYYPQR